MDTLSFDVDSFFASSQEIKREDMGIPEMNSPSEEPLTTKRKGSKRAHDPTEIDKRNNRRRENQKVACRNYRMRKKEHLSDLKERIQQLEQEKEQLTKENLAYQMNNNSIKTPTPTIDPNVVSGLQEVAQAMAELEHSYVEDRLVEYYLQNFFVAAGKLHNAFLKDVDELVNPFTQANLASFGYMTSMEYPEISATQVNTWWDSFISSSTLNPDQICKLQDVINKLCKRDSELRMERGVIDKQIKQFYLHKLMIIPLMSVQKPSEQLDSKTILDFTWLLNRLKTNIITQKSLLLNTQSVIGEILTPRQHASLILKVCHSRFFEWPYHAQVLRTAWDMVSHATPDTTVISQNHPLNPPSSPYTSPYSPSFDTASPPQYFAPSSPYLNSPSPTVVPSVAIPTPQQTFPTQFSISPSSPSLTPNCQPQLSSSGLLQSFLSSLNSYGVY